MNKLLFLTSLPTMIFFKFYSIYAFLVFLFRNDYNTYFSLGQSIVIWLVSLLVFFTTFTIEKTRYNR
jgi:uncharacterized membrane protein (GlpM family)